jgi:serine/arginine repetitive matrix protein 2
MNGNIKLDDDEDPTMGMNHRAGVMNPMMGMGPMGLGMGMGMPQQNMGMMMGNPWMSQPPMLQQFMPPPPQSTDSQLLAAHQHALMAAKQAYQFAVAQQAMQAAGDEWERGSTLGWPSNASTVMFPSGPRSLYAGSMYGGSEYGGPTNGWATGSVYGGGFGPSTANRTPVMARNYQQNGPSPPRTSRIDLSSTNSRPRVKTGPDAPGRPIATLIQQQQQQQGRGRTPPPPSSWKRGAKPQP